MEAGDTSEGWYSEPWAKDLGDGSALPGPRLPREAWVNGGLVSAACSLSATEGVGCLPVLIGGMFLRIMAFGMYAGCAGIAVSEAV